MDVLVNNAGVGAAGYLECFTAEQFARILDVNVLGAQRVNRAVLPSMRQQGAGLLIHISSNLGRLTVPFMGAYAASKHALEAMAEVYRYELRPLGIDSAIIEPGWFPTEIFGKIMGPEDSSRLGAYVAFDPIQDRMFEHAGALVQSAGWPDPREVAEAVLALIETPFLERPLRTVVGSVVTAGVDAHNESAATQQRAHLTSFGVAQDFDF
ncbi:MAG: SDR family NAD(P)-dependent oxidoreductase [Actinomycetia bacterium]|nr:SDR family NAD(P)-dependent oxidoreductase [Actinomycetes bacterium]